MLPFKLIYSDGYYLPIGDHVFPAEKYQRIHDRLLETGVAVAEMYGIHPQTLRLYEREGLLKPSRTEGNTRLYTDEDLQRLEFILSLARDLGVNISGMAIILQMRERMEEMQRQIHEFVQYIQEEVLTRANAAADPAKGAIVPVRRAMVIPSVQPGKKR